MKHLKQYGENVYLLGSEKIWLEDQAIMQLKKSAQLSGITLAIGMPDIHPGNGYPVGAAIISHGMFYPYLIGGDIGCGMSFFKTTIQKTKINLDKLIKKLQFLEEAHSDDDLNGDIVIKENNLIPTSFDSSLGTIGSGNHFAELQLIDKIYNPDLFEQLKLEKKSAYLLVHSGSRGYGNSVYRNHTDRFRAQGLEEGSDEAKEYLSSYQNAVNWAKANRELIGSRFLSCIGAKGERILDFIHNSLSPYTFNGESAWIHRKGAIPADQGAVVIPGSRGALSYIVMPKGDREKTAYSLAHGAGRKWGRGEGKSRLKKRYSPQNLLKTGLGSRVICTDRDLLYDEAPQAYKNIAEVINTLVEADLIDVIATLQPALTFKTNAKKEKK